MHLKVFLKLKNPKQLSLLGKKTKIPKKPQKTQNPKKTTELGLKKTRVFSNPG